MVTLPPPDTPTLVDIPKHAQVLPDFNLALRSLTFTSVVRDDVPSQTERLEDFISPSWENAGTRSLIRLEQS